MSLMLAECEFDYVFPLVSYGLVVRTTNATYAMR